MFCKILAIDLLVADNRTAIPTVAHPPETADSDVST